ncbi:hypothetical protein SAMN04488505_1011312 [Chitinophaga rupis]|uniref:Glycosyltransferase 2-like domain-containing protein n=1 Tax=Chitinophaga rupis TaxID=573321 RepID=A0A1H7LRT1_9BACT|nr:glycosyltransferase [Chitinophaga rupis]SEL01165.1 hypothetical protein SAMN04488505_1011312 [Chitinophaga rupis]
MYDITSSIVIYKNAEEELNAAITSFLNTSLNVKLYLVDNSPTNVLSNLAADPRISYQFLNKNIGFGAAHNIALNEVIEKSKYHIILNPDISFQPGTLEKIFSFMESNRDVGQILPKVLYEDGELQRLCKLLPTPFDLILRRFGNASILKKRRASYELVDFDYNQTLNVPNLSGCFMFLRIDTLKKVGFFDTRYFMYLEDIDLTRRIHQVAQTLFFPAASVVHGYRKESYKNKALLNLHITSAIKYFNKWGWFWDRGREQMNITVLKKIKAGRH